MRQGPDHADQFGRYLRLLGVAHRPPTLGALTALTRAHLSRVPFENISKLYHRREGSLHRPPDFTRFLDGIERHHLGGTCYASAFHFHQLLTHLGYDVALCGADMSAPDVHMVNIVRLEGHPYLVDVGYGAPLLAPLPLDLEQDHEIVWGRDRYLLRPPDAAGRSRLELHRDGRLQHGYLVNPAPREIEEFASVISDSFSDRATFMHAVLVARFWPTGCVTVRNLRLTQAEGGTFSVRPIPCVDHLPRIIETHFRIPADLTRQALADVELTMEP
jgi:arylamine N-acetyltransferase